MLRVLILAALLSGCVQATVESTVLDHQEFAFTYHASSPLSVKLQRQLDPRLADALAAADQSYRHVDDLQTQAVIQSIAISSDASLKAITDLSLMVGSAAGTLLISQEAALKDETQQYLVPMNGTLTQLKPILKGDKPYLEVRFTLDPLGDIGFIATDISLLVSADATLVP